MVGASRSTSVATRVVAVIACVAGLAIVGIDSERTFGERRVTGKIVGPVSTCMSWLDVEHQGEVTRVHYPSCVLPDAVIACPQSSVMVVGNRVGPWFVEARAVLGRSPVKGHCGDGRPTQSLF